jgi:rod shape determining protein RodA
MDGPKTMKRWLLELLGKAVRTLDWPLLLALLALMGIGLMVQYSAGGDNYGMRNMLAHGSRFAIGLAAMWALSRVPLVRLRGWSPGVYLASLLPLLLVLVMGTGKHGQLWINLKLFYLQPSELLKITLPMALAWYLNREVLPPRLPTLVGCAALIGIPIVLILLQPDLGTALLIAAGGVMAVYLSGLSWKWILPALAVGVIAYLLVLFAPMQWFGFLSEYQQNRILIYRDPTSDLRGAGWNIAQSQIAIGAGGLTGKGWGQGTQAHLDYLPEHTTDFIFSVLSEEFGWLGVALVLALYLFVVGRCLWIAMDARDTYSRLLAGTLGLSFFVYVIVNGGMVSGLLPVVGVPMPLLSYGGTSAVSLLAGLGLVMAVKAYRPVHGR